MKEYHDNTGRPVRDGDKVVAKGEIFDRCVMLEVYFDHENYPGKVMLISDDNHCEIDDVQGDFIVVRRMFDVWSEGYSITGNKSGAMFHGQFDADSFRDACVKCFNDDKNFDADKLTYWGCGLYDNEKDARRTFG